MANYEVLQNYLSSSLANQFAQHDRSIGIKTSVPCERHRHQSFIRSSLEHAQPTYTNSYKRPLLFPQNATRQRLKTQIDFLQSLCKPNNCLTMPDSSVFSPDKNQLAIDSSCLTSPRHEGRAIVLISDPSTYTDTKRASFVEKSLTHPKKPFQVRVPIE